MNARTCADSGWWRKAQRSSNSDRIAQSGGGGGGGVGWVSEPEEGRTGMRPVWYWNGTLSSVTSCHLLAWIMEVIDHLGYYAICNHCVVEHEIEIVNDGGPVASPSPKSRFKSTASGERR